MKPHHIFAAATLVLGALFNSLPLSAAPGSPGKLNVLFTLPLNPSP